MEGYTLSILDWLSTGLWDLSAWGIVAYMAVMTHITIVTVTVYLHRHSAHRAVDLHPLLQHFFRFWSWMTTGMITKEWTAIHRKHHVACETEEDPHSPVIQGLSKILWQGADVYREASAKPEIMERYGSGCPEDWLENNLYGRFNYIGVAILLIINVVLFGAIGLTLWAIQMIWIPFFGAGVINGIGHVWGYRNYECPDAATNIVPWGIFIGGEELHNNHHTYPNSAKFSQKWWEFDLGWMWLRIFQTFGLAQPKSTGPIVAKVPGKTTLDMDTAWAVLNDRFRLMAKYQNDVVKPLIKLEYDKADHATRDLLRRARTILCREDSLVDAAGREKITKIVESSRDIQVIYEMRMRLQEIWAKRGGNAEELLNALVQWCRDAEATGMQTLRDFVSELKSYSVPQLAKA